MYLADTFGSFLPGDIRDRLGVYRKLCPGKKLGFHGHNNTQMALTEADVSECYGSFYEKSAG